LRPSRIALPLILAGLLAPLAHATRYFWLIPGTAGTRFGAVLWHHPSGSILAASGPSILRIDPVTGARQPALVLSKPGQDGKPSPAATVLDFTVGPKGVDFIYAPLGQTVSDGRICRLDPEGGNIRVIARLMAQGAAGNEAKAVHPVTLVGHPGTGELLLAVPFEPTSGRVLRLTPKPEAGDPGGPAKDGGFDLAVIAGQSGRDLDDPAFDLAIENVVEPATAAVLDPKGLALEPGGQVLVADRELNRICRLIPRAAAAGGGFRLAALPNPEDARTGEEDWTVAASDEGLELQKPHQVALGGDGTVYALAHDLVWSFGPAPDPGTSPSRIWRVIAGKHDAGVPWSPEGVPALQLASDRIDDLKRMAAGPGGSLLFTGGEDGIRILGPEGDAALAKRVQAHRQAEAAEDWPRVRRIWRALARQRMQGLTEPIDLPFVTLCRDANLDPRLDADVLGVIGSFLVDSRWIAFRATLALHAIRQGSPFEQARQEATTRFAALEVPAEPEGIQEPAERKE